MSPDRQTDMQNEIEAITSGPTAPAASNGEWLFNRDVVEHAVKQCTPKLLRELLSITGQQSHVLCGFLKGETDKHIAGELDLSAKTVGRHMDDLRNRLAVPCRAELMKHVLVRVLAHIDTPPHRLGEKHQVKSVRKGL